MRKTLEPTLIAPTAQKAIATFHSDVVDAVASAVSQNSIVVVGMAQNPFCSKARKLLEEKGKTFKYLEYGSYLKGWKQRLAIKLWSGWPTYPQVFVDGKLIGGYQELETHLNTRS